MYVTPLDTISIIKRHPIDHHAFTDDTKLQRSCPVDQVHDLISKMQACVDEVKTWTMENKLQLNDGKTEAVDVTVSVTIDSSLSLHQQVTNVCTLTFVKLEHIGSVCQMPVPHH